MSITVEKFANQNEYCKTEAYQSWVGNWKPKDKSIDVWGNTSADIFHNWHKTGHVTPREYTATRYSSKLIFHLLEQLGLENKIPKVDIGCGCNCFSKCYPFIWGVDPKHPNSHEKLTPQWWEENWGKWPIAYAINSMHFVSQSQITHNIKKMVGILSSNGKAFVSLNRARIKDNSGSEYNEDVLLDNILKVQNITRLIWIEDPHNEPGDGNVWIYLKK